MCTGCDRQFPDGSTEMLSGCPDCGGNRFQYIPVTGQDESTATETATPTATPEDAEVMRDNPAATTTEAGAGDTEDKAQADARSSLIEEEQLPKTFPKRSEPIRSEPISKIPNPESPPPAPEDPPEEPNMTQLREQLEDNFESIKIVNRGEYELNLKELYERPECIIELGEHGRYAIHVPETLGDRER